LITGITWPACLTWFAFLLYKTRSSRFYLFHIRLSLIHLSIVVRVGGPSWVISLGGVSMVLGWSPSRYLCLISPTPVSLLGATPSWVSVPGTQIGWALSGLISLALFFHGLVRVLPSLVLYRTKSWVQCPGSSGRPLSPSVPFIPFSIFGSFTSH
jgi:hypothetical protein